MIWTKGTHQSAKFQTFDCSKEISPNLYFDRLLWLKVYKTSAKKVLRIYVLWHRRVMQNSNKNWFVSKMTRIWWSFIWPLEILKISTLIGSFCGKHLIWPKKVQSKYLSYHWRVTQNLKKNWRVVWKMAWGIWDFDRILLSKVENIYISLKFTEELCVMTMKNDAKFEEELTCCFKINMRNLMNFDPRTQKSQKCAL